MAGTKANSYKGLVIYALPGLHEFISTKAVEYFEPGATLLKLAAGTGAMSLRMQDLGFKVTATDYMPENFKLGTVPFMQADLNDAFSFAYSRRFQAILASEIIEHLENPRHFARECFKILEPGGRMVLSTPNVDTAASKASFIRSGSFLWFTEKDYEGHGHITPMTQWQLHKVFTEAGFRFLWKESYGEGASQLVGSPRLRLLTRLVGLISPADSQLAGEIFVAVLVKP
ncbi:MAG: methyltransferase domain-containing protein [Gallionellaceae bacterium]